jgi:hypothetical protein
MIDCGGHSDEEKALLDAIVAEARRQLRGQVVDMVCTDCGNRRTVDADWIVRPVCCGWEMIDLFATLRPRAQQ